MDNWIAGAYEVYQQQVTINYVAAIGTSTSADVPSSALSLY